MQVNKDILLLMNDEQFLLYFESDNSVEDDLSDYDNRYIMLVDEETY